MKNLLPLIFFLFLVGRTDAQRVDFDSLIMPIDTPSIAFEEYLVQLAWMNNPSNDVYDYNINIAKEDITITKRDWADDIGLTFNLNENNIKSTDNSIPDASQMSLDAIPISQAELNALDAERGIVDLGGINNFPRYNLGITLNLGRWITRPNEIRKSKEKLKIEEATLDQAKLEVRAEVLRRYQAYQHTLEIYKVRQEAELDFDQTFRLVKARYKEGTADFEEFSRASSGYQSARESTIIAESDIILAKIDVEEIIGIPLNYAKRFHKEALAARNTED